MNLAEALSALYARVPLGMRLGLDRMQDACARAGHPERAFRAVHVAGTNGKGSTCAMVESIARAAGMRTGLYTSPHLCRFAERIRIDGVPISDAALTDFLERALTVGGDLSFFETATLAAFLAFAAEKVDLAVVEVGLGGRLDATNVLPAPAVTAITSIGFDHTDKLGDTLAAIAYEKASIAKKGVPMVVDAGHPTSTLPTEALDVVARVVTDAGAELVTTGEYFHDTHSFFFGSTYPLGGLYQSVNAELAWVIAELLGIDERARDRGFRAFRWPGRFDRIEQPEGPYLLDGAHNPQGATALAKTFAWRQRSALLHPEMPTAQTDQPAVLVFGAMGDKDWQGTLDALAPLAPVRVYVEPAGRAAAKPRDLAARHPGVTAPSVFEALRIARNHAKGGLVLVAGSLYLVGEARAILLDIPRDPPVAL